MKINKKLVDFKLWIPPPLLPNSRFYFSVFLLFFLTSCSVDRQIVFYVNCTHWLPRRGLEIVLGLRTCLWQHFVFTPICVYLLQLYALLFFPLPLLITRVNRGLICFCHFPLSCLHSICVCFLSFLYLSKQNDSVRGLKCKVQVRKSNHILVKLAQFFSD